MYKTIPFASIAIAIASPHVLKYHSTFNTECGFRRLTAAAAAAVSGDNHDAVNDDKNHKKHKKCKKHHYEDVKHKKYKTS